MDTYRIKFSYEKIDGETKQSDFDIAKKSEGKEIKRINWEEEK